MGDCATEMDLESERESQSQTKKERDTGSDRGWQRRGGGRQGREKVIKGALMHREWDREKQRGIKRQGRRETGTEKERDRER